MPEQIRERRIDAGSVQGPGAYVLVRPLTYGEAKAIRQRAAGMSEAEQSALSELLLIDKVAGWNWVDAAGQTLPLPREDAGVLERLTLEEMEFLSRAVSGDPNAVSG
ncbi:MAG: hypothetical protein IPK19_19320 [Chloroflexi bacterium]|nr:hypothetical protein [Chloroflexota bacterium]